jgi:hypothetical protein
MADASAATTEGFGVECPLCHRRVVTTEAPCECGFRFPRGYLDPRDYDYARLRREAYDTEGCPNGPDEDGSYPCDPKVLLGGEVAECQVCGRVAAWPAKEACPSV